jgi:hypothetical protein
MYSMHHMEAGMGKSDTAKRRAAARRRRRATLLACFAAALALVARTGTHLAVRRATALAVLGKEQCWPLAGGWLSALVVVPPLPASPALLWWPRYVKDESPGEVIRAHEKSVLCPQARTRIRPKRVSVIHLTGVSEYADKTAVCLAHYMDYFAERGCPA